jgi:DNA-directed RNA polymerase
MHVAACRSYVRRPGRLNRDVHQKREALLQVIKRREPDPPPTEAQIKGQILWENAAIEAGIRRYRAELRDRALADTSPGQKIIRQIMGEFVPYITDMQAVIREGLLGPGQPQDWRWLILLLPAEKLAFLTLHAVMSERVSTDEHLRTLTGCARSLTATIEQEVAFQSWVDEERENKREAKKLGKPYRDLYEAMRRSVKTVNNRAFTKWMSRLDRLWRQGWDERDKFKLGSALIKYMVEHSGGHFALDLQPRSGKWQVVIKLSPEAYAIIEDAHARAEVMCPTRRPTLCQPDPWRWADERYVGGYYHLLPGDLIRGHAGKHTADLTNPISTETLQALNTLQNTPWRINGRVYNVMREAWQGGINLGDDLMPPAERQRTERLPDDRWATMTAEEKKKHTSRLAEIHTENARQESKRHSWLAKLDMAGQLIDEPMIWFPYHIDFRGRLYPAVADLSPQGDDAGKALLQFAHGKPLGRRGLFWLQVRAANCWANDGIDKLPLGARCAWVHDNLSRIVEAANSPFDGTRWWTEAEDAWSFLATCFELAEVLECPNPAAFLSHLPVNLDGSCNGLQHLSAMARDPVGALATNILQSEDGDRQDIYDAVKEAVKDQVAADAGKDNELAQLWLGNVNRKVVKRAVLTTPYGVSSAGISRQLITDGHTKAMGDKSGAAADYLRDCIIEVLDGKMGSAKQIMAWLQAVAGALAEHEIPFEWRTPIGNAVRQAYWDFDESRVQTLAGKIVLQHEQPAAGFRKRKQRNAAAPNLVHSFDAAHLCLTVNACARVGLLDFAMVHDSYGCHAGDTEVLSYVLRDEFEKMHATPWLLEIEDYVRGYAPPEVMIPSPADYLQLGDYRILQGVMRSEFFFA